MESIREQLRNPLVAGIVGAVLGLIVGWFIIGWWLWPVEYVGAGPADLRMSEKVDYLRMAAEAYAATGDAAEAQARYNALGDEAEQALNGLVQNPRGLTANELTAFAMAVTGAAVAPPAATPQPGETIIPTVTAAAGGDEGGSFLGSVLPILCGLTLLLIATGLVVYFLNTRGAAARIRGPLTPAQQAREAARQATFTDYQTSGAEPPMAQFMASYKLGDDLFDDSFSIDSPAGEFLGECGVGISETIGVGDPKRVTAFEVWMFDKNDIQTVTNVLMSAHAYNDDATRQRLAAKGDPVLAAPGVETKLETQTLIMVARVIDMGYGEGALPDDSFFDRFIVELAVWPKA